MAAGGAMDLVTVLKAAVDQGCSDIHIVVAKPPMMRRHGTIMPVDASFPALTAADTMAMIHSMLHEDQRARLDANWELDLSYEVPGLSRFRVNVLVTLMGLETVMRVIGAKIPDAETIALNKNMLDLAALPRGLVLVTGPTGCGKSTTLACLLDRANQTRSEHILTIEDPIEFIFESKQYDEAGFLQAALERIVPHLEGDWSAAAFLYNEFNDEVSRVGTKGPRGETLPETLPLAETSNRWLDAASFCVALGGKTAAPLGFLVARNEAAMALREKGEIEVALTAAGQLVASALQNIRHDAEERLRARLQHRQAHDPL